MNIETYYSMLAMIWIAWLLHMVIYMVYSEALHDKIMVIEYDDWSGDREYCFKDQKGKSYNLVSETKEADSTFLLLTFGVFLIPVFGTYNLVMRRNIGLPIGFFLTFVLIFVLPYAYNGLLLLTMVIDSGQIVISWG